MKDDKILIAGIIGALSTIPSEIVTQWLVFIGVGKNSIYNISSILITANRPSLIIGLFVSPIVGGFSAILFYYALMKLGSFNIIIKSLVVSLLFWICLETVFTLFIEGNHIAIRPISDYYVHLIGAVVFAITEGILFRRFLFYKRTI